MFPDIALASTLGWTAPLTTVAQEVRNIGFVCVTLAIMLCGIYLVFRRRMEELGTDLTAISVGAVLITTAITAGAALVGNAAGATLGPVAGPGMAEGGSTLVASWLLQSPLCAVAVWAVRRLRHG